jgi:2'-deoxynucleoside 5'-phosphate N-hydrolase
MRIYFAGSIRGGREDWSLYKEIIRVLREYGDVLTEHIGDPELSVTGEDLPDAEIHKRDLDWLRSCDYLVAEVTRPSLGVGYEIGKATEWGKRVLCIYRTSVTPKLSAMIAGCELVSLQAYDEVPQQKSFFEQHIKN